MSRPRSVRRTAKASFAGLAVLAAAVAVVHSRRASPSGRTPPPIAAAPNTPDLTGRRPRNARQHPEPSPSDARVPAQVRAAARGFLESYLEALHGRSSIRAIRHATPELLRELRRDAPRITPTYRQTHTRLRQIVASVQATGTARVAATVRRNDGPSYRLLLYLERRRSGCRVTRIGDA
jgi:hypothetical protein